MLDHHFFDSRFEIRFGHLRDYGLRLTLRSLDKFRMPDNPEKVRLDALLVRRGFFESRERAQRALMAGIVRVGGHRADKPGIRVPVDAEIAVEGGEKFVGRGGLKLEAALDAFGIDPSGRVCLDIGASTGGFTDCLLQRGATRVHALDVGHNQLHWKIRSHARVRATEGINCRHLAFDDVGEFVDLVVADVSFISLTLILPPAFHLLQPEGTMVVLIKPQFECPRGSAGRGGVVSDPQTRLASVEKIRVFAETNLGLVWGGSIESPIRGAAGNIEYLACLRR